MTEPERVKRLGRQKRPRVPEAERKRAMRAYVSLISSRHVEMVIY